MLRSHIRHIHYTEDIYRYWQRSLRRERVELLENTC